MRYFFEIAYDGTNYHGWQRQENAISVQQVVEEALSTISRTPILITGSGRTDTGVHCEQQFFHADLISPVYTHQLVYKLNSLLPKDIAIKSIQQVSTDAHARFSAISRSYEYRITAKKNPFLVKYAHHYNQPLDLKSMNAASALLMGAQDFESFSKVKTEVNNFICDITFAKWTKTNEMLFFNITSNRFLRGMVRAIVGTLLKVGAHQMSVGEFMKVIEARDRRTAGAAAPAQGLFLTQVGYPEAVFNNML